MLYVYTLFDPSRDGRPLATGIYDSSARTLEITNLYLPKSGRCIYDIEKDIQRISSLIQSASEIHLNDLKQHLIGFRIGYDFQPRAYDHPILQPTSIPPPEAVRQSIADGLKRLKTEGPSSWTLLRGNAAPVFRYLQDKGVIFNSELQKPIWHMDLYSGRTRTTGFAIQGLDVGAPIANVNGDPIFVNFDWVSADFRVASILSGDEQLMEAFRVSDPYSFMADTLNEGATDNLLSRDESKLALLKSLYQMDASSLDFYAGLRDWMLQCAEVLDATGQLRSILGRPFTIDAGRSRLSVFNAVVQGSVEHAMEASIRAVWDLYPDSILTENHDSLLMTSRLSDVPGLISDVVPIMTRPFAGILNTNPVFPVVVSIGRSYKKWKRYRRFGDEQAKA